MKLIHNNKLININNFLKEKNYKKALDLIEELEKSNFDNKEILKVKNKIFLETKNWLNYKKNNIKLLALVSYKKKIYYNIGVACFNLGNLRDACNYFNKSLGWSSGPTALWLASEHDHNIIYMIGFDYMGLGAGKLYNNVYANTKNYMQEGNRATYYHNWLRQTEEVIRKNQQINYCRVILPDNLQTHKLNSFVNYNTMLVDDFHIKVKI